MHHGTTALRRVEKLCDIQASSWNLRLTHTSTITNQISNKNSLSCLHRLGRTTRVSGHNSTATKQRIASPASTTATNEHPTPSHHVGRHHQTLDGICLPFILHANTITSFTNKHQILFQNYIEYETSNCHCRSPKR